jgi:hypothetical protein
MKRFVVIAALLLLCFSLSASAKVFRFGYGIGVDGNNAARTEIKLNFTARPFSSNVMNPFVRAEYGVGMGRGGFGLTNLTAVAGVELFRSMKNPLSFTMANKGPWSPALSAGITTDFTDSKIYAELSPFRVLDKDFIYEWFTVFAVFDRSGIEKWGVCLLRFTSMF